MFLSYSSGIPVGMTYNGSLAFAGIQWDDCLEFTGWLLVMEPLQF